MLDNQINQLKTKSLECINYILNKTDHIGYVQIGNGTHQIVNGLKSLLPVLIQSMIFFG